MNLNACRDRLRSGLADLGFSGQLASIQPVADIDVTVGTPCFLAFFKLVDSFVALEATWRRAQDAIARYKAEQKEIPRDLYLTLFLLDTTPPQDLEILQTITRDIMICRKIVLLADPNELAASLESLPFMKLGAGSARPAPGISQVFSAFEERGYPREILDILSDRASIERMLGQLLPVSPPPNIPHVRAVDLPFDATSSVGAQVSRLQSVAAKHFRGLQSADIDLSANITVIYGQNGTGKTSVFDAIEWALLGGVERLDTESKDDLSGRSPYVNLFSSNAATVELMLKVGDASVSIKRACDINGSVNLFVDQSESGDDRQLLNTIVGQQSAKLDIRVLRRLVRATSFLSQSSVKQFLIDDPRQRYSSLAHLLGTQDYIRVLDKLDELRKESDKRVASLSDALQNKDAEAESIRAHLRGRESLLSGSPETRELDSVLTARRHTAVQALTAAQSPYATIFPSSQGFHELQSSVAVASDWADKESRQSQLALDATTVALEASGRRSELLRAIAELEGQIADIQSKAQVAQEHVSRRREEQARKRLELNQVTVTATDSKARLGRLREALVILGQMKGLKRLAKEQEEQAGALDRELRTHTEQRESMVELLTAATAKRQSVAAELTRLRQQVHALDAVEALSASYAQLALDKPSLTQQLRKCLSDTTEQHGKKSELEVRIVALRQELSNLSAERATHLEQLERLGSLVLELQQFITSPECPLCGHAWESLEQLKRVASERTNWASPRVKEVDAQIAQLLERITATEAGLKYAEGELARLAAVRTETEGRIQQIDDQERQMRELLLRATASQNSVEIGFGLAQLKAQRSAELAAMSAEDVAFESQIRGLKDELTMNEAERSRREEVGQRMAARLAETERKLNNLAEQLSDAGVDALADDSVVDLKIEEAQREVQSGDVKRSSLLSECSAVDAALEQATLSMDSLTRTRDDQSASLLLLQQSLKRAEETISQAQLDPASSRDEIERRAASYRARIAALEQARVALRQLGQIGSWLIARQEIQVLNSKLDEIMAAKEGLVSDSERLQAWHSHLSGLYVALMDVKAAVENLQLDRYGPTINLLYQRLNTHPLFKEIRVLVDAAAQSVRITLSGLPAIAKDSVSGALAPTRYFSEAQLNVLALSIFLSHSLQQRWSRFIPLLLDDPVQNMDDFNANGFIDCIRSLAADNDRQFVLSTSDVGFYRLLLLKLRCMNYDGVIRFRAYRFEGISAAGSQLVRDWPAGHAVDTETAASAVS